MAENDRFETSLGAGWRTAAQYVENENVSPEEVDDKLLEALGKCLRRNNGIPGFQELTLVLNEQAGLSSIGMFAELDEIVRSQLGHRHTKVAARVTMSMLALKHVVGGTMEPMNLGYRLAENVCLALLRHYFFARVQHRMIAKGKFSDHNEFFEWQSGVENSIQPGVSKIAAQLLENPYAADLRAPRKSSKKVPTSVLLKEVLA
ncbi:MAG: hypothetical protein OXF76_14560 [Caldilineaceae bacterium]|nr:hypothetical protein [Caldilineaceae bacterium]